MKISVLLATLAMLCMSVLQAQPIYLLGGVIPSVVLQGGLTTNLALLGAGKLGLAALYAKNQPQAEEETGYPSTDSSSIFRRIRQQIKVL